MSEVELIARYLSRLAHDIRNASGLLQLNLQMLDTEVRSSRGQACIEDAAEAVNRLEVLANRLSQTLNPPTDRNQNFDAQALATECLEGAQDRRTQEGVGRLTVEFELDGVSYIDGSTNFWRCVLDTLFDNALDALETKPGNRKLGVHIEPFSVRVSNTGPRIDAIGRIFTPFYSSVGHGRFRAGLGLTRVMRYAERVGATIHSENTPAGPVFTIVTRPRG